MRRVSTTAVSAGETVPRPAGRITAVLAILHVHAESSKENTMPQVNARKIKHLLLLTAATVLAGCASSGGSTDTAAAAKFPAGRYQQDEIVIVMNPDGSYLGTDTSGKDWVKGRYTVEGDQLVVTDSWYDNEIVPEGPQCVGKQGRYHWTETDGTLTFSAVGTDPCSSRQRGVTHGSWKRQ